MSASNEMTVFVLLVLGRHRKLNIQPSHLWNFALDIQKPDITSGGEQPQEPDRKVKPRMKLAGPLYKIGIGQ